MTEIMTLVEKHKSLSMENQILQGENRVFHSHVCLTAGAGHGHSDSREGSGFGSSAGYTCHVTVETIISRAFAILILLCFPAKLCAVAIEILSIVCQNVSRLLLCAKNTSIANQIFGILCFVGLILFSCVLCSYPQSMLPRIRLWGFEHTRRSMMAVNALLIFLIILEFMLRSAPFWVPGLDGDCSVQEQHARHPGTKIWIFGHETCTHLGATFKVLLSCAFFFSLFFWFIVGKYILALIVMFLGLPEETSLCQLLFGGRTRVDPDKVDDLEKGSVAIDIAIPHASSYEKNDCIGSEGTWGENDDGKLDAVGCYVNSISTISTVNRKLDLEGGSSVGVLSGCQMEDDNRMDCASRHVN